MFSLENSFYVENPKRLMSHIEFRPKCLPSDVLVVISKQLALPLWEGGSRDQQVNTVSSAVIYAVQSVHKVILYLIS